jgi:hypothetical protein
VTALAGGFVSGSVGSAKGSCLSDPSIIEVRVRGSVVRGFFVFLLGIVLGILVLALFQVFVAPPPVLPAAPASNADLIILFRNEFLTRELQAQAAQVNSPITPRGLAAQGQADGTLVVSGTAVVSGLSVNIPVRIVLHPIVNNNRVNVSIVSAQVGTLKLPGDWFGPLESQINDNLNRTLASTSYRIVGVTTTVEGLLVSVVVTR